MGIDFAASRARADGMIRRWGRVVPAVLRRPGASDRPCIAAFTAILPMERLGKLTDPLDRKVLVSSLAPDGSELDPPVFGKDSLVTFNRDGSEDANLRIVEPRGSVGWGAVTVFWP